MSDFHQYFSTRPVINITMPSSKRIRFVGGQYITDNPDEIAFLDEQVKAGHSMIYVDKNKKTLTKEELDPMAVLKKKIIEEHEAQKAKQANPSRDMGTTEAKGVGLDAATTRSIASIVAGPQATKK